MATTTTTICMCLQGQVTEQTNKGREETNLGNWEYRLRFAFALAYFVCLCFCFLLPFLPSFLLVGSCWCLACLCWLCRLCPLPLGGSRPPPVPSVRPFTVVVLSCRVVSCPGPASFPSGSTPSFSHNCMLTMQHNRTGQDRRGQAGHTTTSQAAATGPVDRIPTLCPPTYIHTGRRPPPPLLLLFSR